jgi:hypothetical protein
MIANDELDRIWKEEVVSCVGTHESRNQDCRGAGRDSNRLPLKYKDTLPIKAVYFVYFRW